MSLASSFIGSSRVTLAVGVLGALAGLASTGWQLFDDHFGRQKVVVASSPAGASIKINGSDYGNTPQTIELTRGTYTIEATRAGFESAQHAVFVSSRETNLVNIQLVPSAQGKVAETTSPTVVAADAAIARLDAEVSKLRAAVLANPEEALSLPVIRERLRVQEELAKALREDLKDVKDQNKWYLGSMIAIVVGLLAVIATLFVALRPKNEA
jgi:PEGA domain